jgi:hypothetical protein
MSFGFIIPTYISTPESEQCLVNCLECIRKYHSELIVLVNNGSSIDINEVSKVFDNVKIVDPDDTSRGEINAYVMFHRHKYFDKAVIMQDSLFLNKKMVSIDKVDTVKFIKYFTDHIKDWHKVKEPKTDYNARHSIITHDDLVLHLIESVSKRDRPDFYEFAKARYKNKRSWVGCFGINLIVDHSFLSRVHQNTLMLDYYKIVKDKRDRMAMESTLPIHFLYLVNLNVLKGSYDGCWGIGKKYFPVTENFTKISLGR